MAINTQTIRIDLNPGKTIPVAFAHQNDTNRQLTFQLYNNGVAFTPSSTTVKFAYKSPIVNGRYSVITGSQMASGTVSGNTVTVTLPAQYTQVSGVGLLTMILTTSGNTLRPVNIRLVVQKSSDGADVISGASDFPTTLSGYVGSWLSDNIDLTVCYEPFMEWLDENPEAVQGLVLGYVTPQMFGAVADGVTDDSTAIQTAVDSGLSVYIPNGVYCIKSPIVVTGSDVTINCDGEIKVSGCDGIILNCYRCHINIAKMSNANGGSYNSTSKLYTYTQTAIKLYANASRAQVCFNDIFLGSARYFENGIYCYCDGSDSDDITNFGILCNNIHFNQIVAMYGIRFAIGALEDSTARNLAYINENNFYDGQIGGNYGVYARKTANQVWEYDGNKFINLDLEDLYRGLDVEFFAYDIIENVRCREAVRGSYFAQFASDCYYNRISTAFVINPLLWNDLNNTQNDAHYNIYTGVVLFQETVDGSLYNRDATVTTCRVRNNIWVIDDPLIRSVRGFTLNNADLDLTTGVRGRLAIKESVYDVTATSRDLTLTLNSGYGKNGVDTFYVKITDESTKRVNVIIDGVTVFSPSYFSYTGMYRCHYYQYLGWQAELLNVADKLGVYINCIPTSIDTDSSIFNDVGYQSGYRINSSGNAVAATELTVTGFISAKNGDTIRIKDCYNANDGGYTRYLYAYDSSFAPLSIIKSWNAGVESGVSAISGSEITIDVSNCAYVRLSAPIINSDSIITVNQPIETSGILSGLINTINSLEARVAALES